LIEDHLASLEDATATVSQEAHWLERKLEEHHHKAASFDRAVDAFLIDGNETAAAASQSRLNSLQQLIRTYAQQLSRRQQNARQLAEAMEALEGQHAAVKANRGDVHNLLAAVGRPLSGRSAPGASLAELTSASNEVVRELAKRLAAQTDFAEPTRSAGPPDTNEHIELVLGRRNVEAQLAQRRARLALRV
jgi:phage shock protein A